MDAMDEKKFFQEIKDNGNLWVAMRKNEVLTLTDSEGISDLPIWSDRERVLDYISDRTGDGLEPVEIPLSNFRRTWISEGSMDFNDLVVNPDAGESRHSAMSKSDFLKQLM